MKKLWQRNLKQFVRFGCVGAVNTIIDFIVYYLSLRWLGERILLKEYNYLIAQLLGFAAGTLNAYYMNGRFVFSGKDERRKKGAGMLLKSFIGYGVTFALSEGLLWLWVSALDINKLVAKLINLSVTIPLNFIINKFWTFSDKTED